MMAAPVEIISWTLAAYLIGALPFSVWIGRFFAGRDIRQVGDGNPGATNALKAGGRLAGLLALLLDVGKGALPVALAHYIFAIQGAALIPIAVAPTVGHAFSPFLGWRGGKALAVTFGVWIGLTYGLVSIVSVLLLILFFSFLETDAWSVLAAVLSTGIFITLFYQDWTFLVIFLLQSVVIIYKHRQGLAASPRLRGWVVNILKGSSL